MRCRRGTLRRLRENVIDGFEGLRCYCCGVWYIDCDWGVSIVVFWAVKQTRFLVPVLARDGIVGQSADMVQSL